MTQNIHDAGTKLQLKVLDELSTICDNLGVEFWLRGGWAIDFLLGKITRIHADIDLVAWIQDRDRLEKELINAGYERVPVKEEFRGRQSDFRKENVDVTYIYLTYSDDGDLILNGLPEWIWRKDSLLRQRYTLSGISAKVLSPKQLLEEKEAYEEIGRPYRQKDADSKKILH